jgi:hypothetical protein
VQDRSLSINAVVSLDYAFEVSSFHQPKTIDSDFTKVALIVRRIGNMFRQIKGKTGDTPQALV